MIAAIVLETLLVGDEAGAIAILNELDPADLARLAAAGERLADLAAPHHHCAGCGRYAPLDDRDVPGRPVAVGKAPPMRCTGCAANPRKASP